jgi:hypothetical protein
MQMLLMAKVDICSSELLSDAIGRHRQFEGKFVVTTGIRHVHGKMLDLPLQPRKMRQHELVKRTYNGHISDWKSEIPKKRARTGIDFV